MSTAQPPAELPKQYDHAAPQQRWYQFWEERGYFHAEPDPDREPYTVVIPPPNVTGALHLGHALNNSLQDILVRMKRMQGFNTLWMPGTDHAGIATQAVVERRLREEEGKTRHDIGRDALVGRIWDWKNEYEQRILGQLKQMGVSCDWERTRFTLDPMLARAVRHTFFRFFREQLIYRGKRLVNWDTFLQTAVSDDEVGHETVAGHFWHLRYPVIDPQPGEPTHVTVATTRPETMLGDTAVAVHPDPAKALSKLATELKARLAAAAEKDREAIAEELEQLETRRTDMLALLKQLRDMARDGRQVMLPLLNRPIPLVADEWAKPEMGSGCVKITPAHDPNDYEVGQRQDLPMTNILNPNGTLGDAAGPYAGLEMSAAREKVVDDLDALGLLAEVEDRQIEIAHSDRSGTPIEPLLADQWFVRMDDLAQKAMDAVTDGRVKILPERYAKGYLDWLSEKRDWPVSRQLWWGHRIPIWYAPTASEADLKAAFADRDDVAWFRDEEHDQWLICAREEDLAADAIPGHTITQEDDVLDTWFSSALWPHSTLGWPEKTPELEYFYPTSTLVTSRDIITLWVARMVIAGLVNVGDVPFREVYIHPKILDGYGEGMSKTRGNGVDPLDVIEKFGADSLRFGLTYLSTETQDIRIPVDFECPHCDALIPQTRQNRMQPAVKCSQCGQQMRTQWATKEKHLAFERAAVVSDRFELSRNFCNKLWNASRFALMNLEGYEPGSVADDELATEDRWILSRLATVTQQVTDGLDRYQFADAARTLYGFAWDEFCSFYLEMIKHRLQDDATRPVAQRVLAHTLDTLLRLLHPMIPFITEEVWQLLGGVAAARGIDPPVAAAESVMIAPWPESDAARRDTPIEQQFTLFQEVLGGIREIRTRQSIAPRDEIEFLVNCDAATAALLEPMQPAFVAMARAKATAWGESVEAPATSASFRCQGLEVFVDLSGLIDVEAEIARLEKAHANLLGQIVGKEKKLANDAFVSRAPAEVVQKERDRLAELGQESAAVAENLGKLRDSTT